MMNALREVLCAQVDGDESKGSLDAGEVWSLLVDGHAVLRDTFESAGRHFFIVERRTEIGAKLTERERRVGWLAAHGHANKVIASDLGVSASTVAGDRSSIRRKVGASSRIALIQCFAGMLPSDFGGDGESARTTAHAAHDRPR